VVVVREIGAQSCNSFVSVYRLNFIFIDCIL